MLNNLRLIVELLSSSLLVLSLLGHGTYRSLGHAALFGINHESSIRSSYPHQPIFGGGDAPPQDFGSGRNWRGTTRFGNLPGAQRLHHLLVSYTAAQK